MSTIGIPERATLYRVIALCPSTRQIRPPSCPCGDNHVIGLRVTIANSFDDTSLDDAFATNQPTRLRDNAIT